MPSRVLVIEDEKGTTDSESQMQAIQQSLASIEQRLQTLETMQREEDSELDDLPEEIVDEVTDEVTEVVAEAIEETEADETDEGDEGEETDVPEVEPIETDTTILIPMPEKPKQHWLSKMLFGGSE